MKISAILIALGGILSFGAQGVFAGCYGSGDSWPNVEEARTFISDACHKSGGMFTGNFEPRQTKSMCPRSGSKSLGLLFEVQNLNKNTGFDLGNNDCYDKLTALIFDCGRGGDSVVAGWRFRADPGAC